MDKRVTMLTKLTDIDKLNYQGYIWLSDSTEPVLHDFDFSKERGKQFIVEGFLYDRENDISISIKYLDGEYAIIRIDLKDLDHSSDCIVRHSYLADAAITKQKEDYMYLKFIECWDKKIDELCSKMEVYQPTWIAFTGFTKKGGEK